MPAIPDGIRVLRTILRRRQAGARAVEDALGMRDWRTLRPFAPTSDTAAPH